MPRRHVDILALMGASAFPEARHGSDDEAGKSGPEPFYRQASGKRAQGIVGLRRLSLRTLSLRNRTALSKSPRDGSFGALHLVFDAA